MRQSQQAWLAYRAKKKAAQRKQPQILPKLNTAQPATALQQDPPQRSAVPRSGSRVGFGISLFIHLLLFLFAVFYVIDMHQVEDAAVDVDILQQAQKKSRLRRRAMPRILEVQAPRVASRTTPRTVNVASTAAQIPVSFGEPAIPAYTPHSVGDGPNDAAPAAWGQLDRRAISPTHQVETVRSPIIIGNAAPPQLEVDIQAQSLASDTLQLRAFESIGPVIPLNEATRLPRFIGKVVPRYPEMARRVGKEGVVLLEAEIGADGTARNIKVIQGLGYGCDEAAVTALRSSRFFPAYKGDRSVAVRIQIPYRFRFEEM